MIDGFLIELWVVGAICSCTFAVVYQTYLLVRMIFSLRLGSHTWYSICVIRAWKVLLPVLEMHPV